jgi:hypothetical protein
MPNPFFPVRICHCKVKGAAGFSTAIAACCEPAKVGHPCCQQRPLLLPTRGGRAPRVQRHGRLLRR